MTLSARLDSTPPSPSILHHITPHSAIERSPYWNRSHSPLHLHIHLILLLSSSLFDIIILFPHPLSIHRQQQQCLLLHPSSISTLLHLRFQSPPSSVTRSLLTLCIPTSSHRALVIHLSHRPSVSKLSFFFLLGFPLSFTPCFLLGQRSPSGLRSAQSTSRLHPFIHPSLYPHIIKHDIPLGGDGFRIDYRPQHVDFNPFDALGMDPARADLLGFATRGQAENLRSYVSMYKRQAMRHVHPDGLFRRTRALSFPSPTQVNIAADALSIPSTYEVLHKVGGKLQASVSEWCFSSF